MKKRTSSDHKKPVHRAVSIPAAMPEVPDLHETERMIHLRTEAFQRGVLSCSDRCEAEERVLRILAHALDPTVTGLANLLGQKPEEAGVLLGKLAEAGLVWQQVTGTGAPGWHLSSEGQHYLTERGLFPPAPPHP